MDLDGITCCSMCSAQHESSPPWNTTIDMSVPVNTATGAELVTTVPVRSGMSPMRSVMNVVCSVNVSNGPRV